MSDLKFYSEDTRLRGDGGDLKSLRQVLRSQALETKDNSKVLRVALKLHEIENTELAGEISEVLGELVSQQKTLEEKFDRLMQSLIEWFNWNVENLEVKKKP